MLQYLLTTVINFDSDDSQPETSDLLGKGRTGWIHSITTISTPHDGTTLSDIVTSIVPFLQDFIAVAAVVGNDFYDFDLQQWGFGRKADEPWMDYFRRMRVHPAWGTQNISAWDVSLEGARNLNTKLTASPEVYYFSYATTGTVLEPSSGRHLPDEDMHLILLANARIMGRFEGYWGDGRATDSTWFENDGVVNTVSMTGPTTGLNGADPVAIYRKEEALIPGQWYFVGSLKVDHRKIIGHGIKDSSRVQNMFRFFDNHCSLLLSLNE